MEKSNAGITILLNPAKQGSPAAKLGKGIHLSVKTSINRPSDGFHTHLYCIDFIWFITKAIAIYPRY